MKNLLSTLISTFFSLLFISLTSNNNTINAQWVRTNGPGGAKIYCFISSGNNIFAGAEGAVFMSSDNGSNWKEVNNGLPEHTSILSLATNGNAIFAGTSDKGIYVSTNSGASWTEANNGLPDLKSGVVSALVSVGDTVFAGGNNGIQAEVYFSKDNGASWTSVSNGLPEQAGVGVLAAGNNRLFAATYNGLYRSTNNGMNWQLLDSGITVKSIKSIAVKGDTIYAGTEGLGYGGEGIYRSFDGGTSWKLLPTGFSSSPTFKAMAVKDNYVFAGSIYGGGFYRSADNGDTWSNSTTGLTDQGINALLIKDNLVFAGTYSGGVFVSSDKGLSWQSVSKGMNYSTAAAMIIKDGILFAGTPGGVYTSSDDGESWNFSNNGLGSSSITSFALSGNDILAVSDNGIYRTSGNGQTWISITYNLPKTKFNTAITIGGNIFIGTDDGIFISSDKGTNWKPVNNGMKTHVDTLLRVTNFAVLGNMLIAGASAQPFGGGIFISTDNGSNWKGSIINEGSPFHVYSMAVKDSKIFAGYTEGSLHRPFSLISADSGKTWRGIAIPLNPAPEITEFFIIGSKIYALSVGVFLYSEADSAWTNAEGVFPDKLISMAYNSKYVFAGTEGLGIFRRPVSELVILTPEKPKLTSVENNSRNQPLTVNFDWEKVSTADIYQLQVAKDSLFKELVLNDSSSIYPSGYITGLTNSTTYYWHVRAKNSAGLSPWSDVWNFTTMPALAASPVLSLPKDSSTGNPLTLKFLWKATLNTDHYRLIVSEDDKFSIITSHDSTLTDTLKEVKDLKEGMKYYWKVCSRNSAGDGPFSESWNFTTLLYAPESLKVNVVNNKTLKFSWKDNSSGELGFVIERKLNQDFKTLDTLKANVTSYTDTSAVKLSSYQFRVKAYTRFASSAYSNTVSVTLTALDESKIVPKEYALFQNYPNPFNPVTTFRYRLPEKSFVEIRILDMLGRMVTSLVNKEQDIGEYNYLFNASCLPSGVYIYSIHAGKFRDFRKFILLK